MLNSIVKFDTTDVFDDYIVSDYFSRKLYTIYDLPEINDISYIDYYQLTDNETIEYVSYKLYGTAMYWDVILYINMHDPLFSMVYDYDFSRLQAEEFVDKMNTQYIGTLKEYYNPIRDEEYNIITSEPVIEDIIAEQANSDETIPDAYLDTLKDLKTIENELIKEDKRTIKILRPEKISDFMRILRQQQIIG